MSGNKLILKLDDAANTASYNEALQYFESLGFRGKTASDLAIEKVHNNVLFDAGTLPDVDVVAKAWGDGDDASRRENYQKARKAERESDEKALQHEMNQSIRSTTDKWGKGIGSGLEMISGFTPLWWVAPAVRTGLDLSEGNYKGAALNAAFSFAAPYAIGNGILYVTPHVKSAIIASKLNRLINKTTLPQYSTRYYTKSVGLPGHVNYTLHNADGSVAGGLRVESPYSAGTRGTHIEMVHKTSGSKGGVSEDLYNIAVKDALRAGLPGVESGLDLMNPLLTKHVTSKFPHIEEMIGTPQMVKNPTTGKWEFKQTIPGRMLTGTTSKLLALEAPQGHFITNYSATANNPPPKTSLAFFERLPAKISEAERLGIPKGVRNNKNIVREVPDSQLDDKIWVLKDGTYLEGTFRDIKPGQLFKYDPQDAISYTYTNGPDKNPLNPDRYLLSDGEFLGLDYMSEYGGNSFLRKDSPIYNHIKMLSNSLLHDKLKAIAADIQMPRELYALFLNPRYIQSFKQYYLNKGWRVGNLADEEIAKIIAYNHKLLTSNLTGVAKDVILWNGSGKQMTADGAVVREAAPDNFKIITENLQGGGGDIRGVWFSDFNDALSYGYPKQIGGSRQHTWEGVLLVDILPYLINDARGHMSAGYKFDGHTAPKNLILHSRELVSGDLDNIKGLFPHPELILLEGNGFTRSWSTKGLHYKKGGTIKIKKKNKGTFAKVRDYVDYKNNK